MTKTYLMNGFIEKMQSQDQDFRYMGLSDLMKEIKADPQSYYGDEAMEMKVLRQVLSLVEDKISEVKNQAVKCLGQLIKIIRESQMEFVVDSLIQFTSSKDEELRDIAGLALKTITSELPQDGAIAPMACAKLTPKLLSQGSSSETTPETLIETLSILSILVTRFPTFVAKLNIEPSPVQILAPLLSHPCPAVRKRAITTIAQFVPLSSPQIFAALSASEIGPNLAPSANVEKQRTTVQFVAAIARASPQLVAVALNDIVPGILNALRRDDDEIREGSLQALDALVLKCPAEVTPFLPNIIQAANQFIKYDPNYTGDVDEDEEMAEDADDEDAELDDEYSDEEDTSYKIRRSATKLLGAIIGTRPELLISLYKEVSPVLISRFGDREETVRLEVWATYVALLTQTSVYAGGPQSKDAVGVKRKRDEGELSVEDNAYSLLQSQVPSLAKALLNQLKPPKTSSVTLQAAFALFRTLLNALPGCLSNQTAAIVTISKSVLSQPPTNSTATLHISCLQFLSLFFYTHPPPTFTGSLSTLTPALQKALGERHPRVASETFRLFSSLLNAMKPVKNQDWVESVYSEAIQRLSKNDTDAEVRAAAEDVIADLWICATDVVKGKDKKEWEYICRTSGRTDNAVKAVAKVAADVDVGVQWINDSVEWALTLLKKSGRAGKVELFECLSVLIAQYETVPVDLPVVLVPQLKSYLSTSDISLLSQSLSTLALLLQSSPKVTFPEVEREVLKDIYAIARSPLLSGAALDALLSFFSALVEADSQIAVHVLPSLVSSVDSAPRNEVSLPNVAKCVAQVVKSAHGVAAGAIAEFSRHIKSSSKATPSRVVLSFLVLGEVGRFIDMSPQQDVFNRAIEEFTAEQEEVRFAASFASGNIAVGNLHHFLPALVKIVELDDQKRLLALHALKEVVTYTSHGQLENITELLWGPLFENSENAEESTRNVAAACIGKLITMHPARYLPQIHARLRDEKATTRATVLSAVRYTFAEPSQSYDEVIAPHILDFLSLMLDEDLNVRRLALSAFNAAARTKPHLIRDHLPTLLPTLYKETALKPDLIRVVQMGPWTHKVDDGLEARKTAYETLYTLLDTCLSKIDLTEFISHVLVGLADNSDEIKVICHMMLFRLSQIAPTAVAQHLSEVTPLLEASMKGPNIGKDTVKQELERAAELQRSTLRAIAALSKINSAGTLSRFDTFLAELRKSSQWGVELNDLVGA